MLEVFNRNSSESWDTIIRSFDNYDVYYLSGYVNAFFLNGDGEPHLLYYSDDGGQAINVVMKRDISEDSRFAGKIPKNKYFDIVTPYGYGGWLIEGDCNLSKLFEEYEKWCIDNNIVSEFVRFHPVLQNEKKVSEFYNVIHLGNTVVMDLSSEDIIWENITSKNRNTIRKAQKNGVRVFRSQNPGIYKIFKQIYDSTMDKDNADSYYYFDDEFYSSILNNLNYQSEIFYAQAQDGEIIAASIMLFANGRLNYHLSGSKREYQKFAPTNLLLYEAALWGCKNSMKSFHLGGGLGGKQDSLFAFKKAFNRKDPLPYYIGQKIFNKEAYENLINIRNEEITGSFFPAYRA